MNKKSQEKSFFILIMIVVIFIVGGLFISGIGASEGEHNGIITAVEYNSNVIFPANLVYVKTDLESTQEDIYCVNDPSLKYKLINLSKSRTPVTIKYRNDFIVWKTQCNGGVSIIYGVEE